MKAELLERKGVLQHNVEEKPLSKTRRILIAILATVLVAAAIIATAAFCVSTIS